MDENTQPVGEATPADVAKEVAKTQEAITPNPDAGKEPESKVTDKADKATEEEADKAKADEGKAKEDEAAKKTDAEEPKFIELDDPIGKVIVSTLQEAGFTVAESDDIFQEAIDTFDLTKIKQDKLVEKLGVDGAAKVMAYARDYYDRNLASVRATVSAVDEVLGGKEARDVIIKWAVKQTENKTAHAAEIASIWKTLETQDPFAAKMAAKRLNELYIADPKTSTKGNMVKGDAAIKEVSEYITRADYIDRYKKAVEAGNSVEIARLDSMRRYSMRIEKQGNR